MGGFKATCGRIYRRLTTFLRDSCLARLSIGRLEKVADTALRFRLRCHEYVRQKQARRHPGIQPEIRSSMDGSTLHRSILEPRPPWANLDTDTPAIPGMLTPAERAYYAYLPRFYRGAGEVVELGPWLGLSTHYLINGLKHNPAFTDKQLHVYDDFTWRCAWMNKWLDDTGIPPLENHACFLPLFEQFMASSEHRLAVTRCKITDYDGNESLPEITWNKGPIEIIIVDCGRPLQVNEAWYRVFAPYFIPNTTLVVMQDWQNYKRVPEEYWENTKLFTDSKMEALDMIHEVAGGGIATFIYRG